MEGITYSGALNSQSGDGSRLFEGRKFWLSSKVPSKSRFCDLIRKNGGTVAKLESQADVWVADHLRPDCIPRGSVSYKFLEDCIKQGKWASQQQYLIETKPPQVREVGDSNPTKSTRTPFTLKDDLILWNCVQDARRNGKSTEGNSMYKEIALAYPHHTFQSWRDRWVKYLRDRIPPSIEQIATVNVEPSLRNPGRTAQASELCLPQRPPVPTEEPQALNRPSKRRQDSAAQMVYEPRSSPSSQGSLNSSSRQLEREAAGSASASDSQDSLFTPEDDKFLLARAGRVQAMIAGRGDIESYWDGVADAREHGTPQEWADHFQKKILPLHEEIVKIAAVQPSSSPHRVTQQTVAVVIETAPRATHATSPKGKGRVVGRLRQTSPQVSVAATRQDERSHTIESRIRGEGEDAAKADKILADFQKLMEGYGHSSDRTLQAVYMTSDNHALAERLLETWRDLGFEDHELGEWPQIPGVWTEADDEALLSDDKARINLLKIRHGKENAMGRYEFLQNFDEEEEDDDDTYE